MAEYVGLCESVAITTPSVTFTDVREPVFNPSRNLIRKMGGKSRVPKTFIGNDTSTIEFTTSDVKAITLLAQGVKCTTVVILFQAAATTVTALTQAIGLDSAKKLSASCTSMVVLEAIRNESPEEGPVDYRVVLGTEQEADGDDAAWTITWA